MASDYLATSGVNPRVSCGLRCQFQFSADVAELG